MASVVRCGSCKTVLAEPSDLPVEQRQRCPSCGSTAREIEKNLAATPVTGADVMVVGVRAEAGASAKPGAVRIDEKLEDAGFDLQWPRLSPGGAWMLRVYDREGNWIDGSMQDDPQDALLAVSERLLPPSN